MKTASERRPTDCVTDVLWLAGAGAFLMACMSVMQLFLSTWFTRCVSAPIDWSLLLSGRV